MSNTLSDEEMATLLDIGARLKVELTCDATPGAICRTCRTAAIRDMIDYLKINGYLIAIEGSAGWKTGDLKVVS